MDHGCTSLKRLPCPLRPPQHQHSTRSHVPRATRSQGEGSPPPCAAGLFGAGSLLSTADALSPSPKSLPSNLTISPVSLENAFKMWNPWKKVSIALEHSDIKDGIRVITLYTYSECTRYPTLPTHTNRQIHTTPLAPHTTTLHIKHNATQHHRSLSLSPHPWNVGTPRPRQFASE